MLGKFPMVRPAVMMSVCATMIFVGQFTPISHAQDPLFSITMLDGTAVETSVAAIDGNGEVIGDNIQSPVNLENVISIESTTAPLVSTTLQRQKQQTRIEVFGGGVVFCDSVAIQEGRLQPLGGTKVGAIDMELIEAIVFRDSEMARGELENRSREKDTIIVQTSDGLKKVAGIFEGFAEGKGLLNFNGKTRKVSLDKITAVILADLSPSAPTGLLVSVELSGQTRISGAIESLFGGELQLVIAQGKPVSVALKDVKRIDIQTDNLAYLSNLTPIAVEAQTVFASQRPWQRDASIEGNPLRLRNVGDNGRLRTRQFSKGLGTQSYSRLVFANKNDFTNFKATVGIDAETKGRGDCEMSVISDGITLWSRRVMGSTDPVEIDIDITGMDEISLVVEPGAQFDLADHADWADARFVKTK